MKFLVSLVSIVLVVFLAAEPAIGQQRGSRVPQVPPGSVPPWLLPKNQQEQEKQRRKSARDKKKAADANSIDSNSVGEPNKVELPEDVIRELDSRLSVLDRQGGEETRLWARGKEEDKAELLNVMQEQVTAELKFLQEVAVEEGAAKTAGAIELLLARRQERYGKVTKKLEKDLEKLKQKEERDKKRRSTRSRERTRTDTRRKTPGTPF